MDYDNLEADWEDDADSENLDDDMWDFGTKAKSKTPSTSICIVCQQPDTLCSNCRKVAYCGKAHQWEH
jgi:hypothetical protein